MTSRWLRVIPALLLFLLFHFQASTSCLCLLFFSGHPELLPLSFPCFRILRVLHRPTHPGTEISTFAEYAYRKACVKENKRQKSAADYICGFTHFPGLLSSLVGVAKCFLFLGRPLPRLVRLRLSSSCSWRSLTQQNNFKRVLVQERRHGSIFRTFVIISRSSDSYSKCASSVKKKNYRLSLRLWSLLSSLCFSLYVFCSSAKRTRSSTSIVSNTSRGSLLYSCKERQRGEKHFLNRLIFNCGPHVS